MNPIERHGRAILQFSGGKDSLACLYLLRPYWDRITAYWMNTGAAFPETIAQIAHLRTMVKVVEVCSDQPAQIAKFGPAADVVPIRATALGRWAMQSDDAPIQSSLDCCTANVWRPMFDEVKASGETLVIRGQRNSDKEKGPIRSGTMSDGIEYWFPLQDWSEADVLAYLKSIDVPLPEHYSYVNSSLDCWSCTAYREHVVGRMKYMKAKHPELHQKCLPLLKRVRDGVRRELAFVEGAIDG